MDFIIIFYLFCEKAYRIDVIDSDDSDGTKIKVATIHVIPFFIIVLLLRVKSVCVTVGSYRFSQKKYSHIAPNAAVSASIYSRSLAS